MSPPSTSIDDYIVRELTPADHESDEAPITIVCEPPGLHLELSGAEPT